MTDTIQNRAIVILNATDYQESSGLRKSAVPRITAMRGIVSAASGSGPPPPADAHRPAAPGRSAETAAAAAARHR